MKRVIFLIILFVTCSLNMQAQQTYMFVQRDTALHLDIYQSAVEPNGYTVVHVFGGGFVKGERNSKWDAEYCRQLAANGYKVASIDYRLGMKGVKKVGLSSIPAMENAIYMAVADCSAAVRFLVEHAAELDIQPDKIILEGLSAGGITVLMTDFARCNSLPFAAELPEGWKPAGVVAYSGVIYSNTGALKWAEAPAPTLLYHGVIDKLVPYKQIAFGKRGMYGANSIVKRFEKFNFPYCVYRCLNMGHDACLLGPATIDELNLFVKEYIAAAKPLYKDITRRDASVVPSEFTYLTLKDIYIQSPK